MHKVVLLDLAPDDGVRLKNQLIADGLTINQDFTWSYNRSTYNFGGYEVVQPRSVTFEFLDAAHATFYQLKWQHNQLVQ